MIGLFELPNGLSNIKSPKKDKSEKFCPFGTLVQELNWELALSAL